MTVFAGDPRAICIIMTGVLIVLSGYLVFTLIKSTKDDVSKRPKQK